MLVPRRVRRRLLLPPGWVALGFLWLLGCQALQPWAGQLKQWNVIQLTMPLIKLALEDLKASGSAYKLPYTAVAELDNARQWHDVDFEGKLVTDFLSAATTESAIREIKGDTSHAGGVRIHFLPGAIYANLVKVLDIMNYTNQKKYWLDTHQDPSTLYAITTLPTPTYPLFICVSGNDRYHMLPNQLSLWQRAVDFYEGLVQQAALAWVPTALLLFTIGFLSLTQLFRAKLCSYNSEP